MKAIFVLFDSLNRRFLPSYGNDWVVAPNFRRLADHSVVFSNCYAGSLPCMPARREMHTGRYNFLHCPWGPLEPFDDSVPELLTKSGVYTHLVSDHYHYWEDPGVGYNTRYSTWECVRGQEGDPWKGEVGLPEPPDTVDAPAKMKSFRKKLLLQDVVNRKYMLREEDMSQTRTFDSGIEFIDTNHTEDRWLLQIECFDPHEPFYAPERFRALYPRAYHGKHFDWPNYERVMEEEEQVEEARYEYAALVSYCDFSLGRVLDQMDKYNLWDDTMLIVGTDHGFLLGEHGWWAKIVQPCYNEVANTPLFIWDPRSSATGVRRESLVQTIDFGPTLLELFGVDIPRDVRGKPLRATIADDAALREAALFGYFGGHVNCTDGRYVYMRGPAGPVNGPLFEYTLMSPGRAVESLRESELVLPLPFTKDISVFRRRSQWSRYSSDQLKTMLFDLSHDPKQERPIRDAETERRMERLLVGSMEMNEAPSEQYERLGLAR